MPRAAAAMGSPPKRMTRARAKAVDTHDPAPAPAPNTPIVAKIMTPAAKAAATRRAKKNTNTRAAEADEEDELLAEAANNATMNATATAPAPETVAKSAPKPRGRPAKTQVVAQVEEEEVEPATPAPAKRTRGRPRKTPVAEEVAAEPESAPVHATRAAAATIAVPPRRPAAYRKKVSFQEEANKENASVEAPKKVVEAAAETGIRAKPTRRAGAARGAAAQATPRKKDEVADKTQIVPEVVAPAAAPKLVSVSSRDELDDAEEDVGEAPKGLNSPTKDVKDIVAPSPPKIIATSPAKPSVLAPKTSTSPTKLFGASLLGSPAKRPPQSPFKHAMRDSPLKASGASMLLGADSRTPLQVSLMSQSPKRFPISTVERKANVHVLSATTDLKRSLFASPPKRPLSPTKQPLSKKGLSLMSAMTSTAHAARKPSVTYTPTRMVATSAFASHKSPAASAKVHKMTPEERDEMMKLELASAPSPFTPWLGRNKTPKEHRAMYRNELRTAPAPFTPASARPHMTRVTSTGSVSGTPGMLSRQDSGMDAEQRLATMSETATPADVEIHSSATPKNDRSVVAHSFTPEGLPASNATQAITPVRDTSYRNTNDESDDELSLSASKLTITNKQKYAQTPPTRGPVTPSSYRNATVSSHNKAGSMTTLANKFGNWKTATPDQKVVDQRKHEKNVFSVANTRRQSMPATPSSTRPSQTPRSQQRGQMTALAQKFGTWTGATPDAKVLEQRSGQKSALSPLKRSSSLSLRTPQAAKNAQTPRTVKAPMTVAADRFKLPTASNEESILEPQPEDFAQFEEAMAILEDSNDMDHNDYSMHRISNTFRASQMSDASQVYGDENAEPMDENDFDDMLAPVHEQVKVITPARLQTQQPRVVHTVTKVPLKPAAADNESPLVHHGRRSQSLAGPLSPQAAKDIRALREIPIRFDSSPLVAHNRQAVPAIVAPPHTPRAQTQSLEAPTPIRTPRPDLNPGLLSAAVVYVDVHTTEGADASGIFIELLMQMGARCVKQWSWNPNAAGDEATTDEHKRVGITHVVFKDGGKRTMEKVRQAKGLVSCVGVAWVLDCERENKWLDEAAYTVDSATVPRGGHRRRKSMEPKALANLNGSLIGTDAVFRTSQLEQQSARQPMSPTKEFLDLDSPASASVPAATPARFAQYELSPSGAKAVTMEEETVDPSTPQTNVDPNMYYDSPTTPYFLHPQDLVQRTCPPKQSQQSLLQELGRQRDAGEEKKPAAVNQRLALMRRRSLQYAPRVASPLARD